MGAPVGVPGSERLFVVADDSGLRIFDARDGREIDAKGPDSYKVSVSWPPKILGDMIYWMSSDGSLNATSVSNSYAWGVQTDGPPPSVPNHYSDEKRSLLAASATMVYFSSKDALGAYSAKTGKISWQLPLPGSDPTIPVLFGDTVYIGSVDGYVRAVDAVSGRLRWKCPREGRSRLRPSSPEACCA